MSDTVRALSEGPNLYEGGETSTASAVRISGADDTLAISYVEEFLACDGTAPLHEVAELLDKIAELIPKDVPSPTASRVAAELNLSRRLYQGRDRFETVQIRGQILFSLSSSYVPDETIIYIDDMLRNSQDPRNRAAAARAAGVLGLRGRELVPALIRVIKSGQLASPVALGLVSPLDRPDAAWTTDRLEAIQALGRIGIETDHCLFVLNNLASGRSRLTPEEGVAAREALEQLAIARSAPRPDPLPAYQGSLGGQDPVVLRATHSFTDQNGERVTGTHLMGRPSAIAFFYTSCRNPGRCSRTTLQALHLRRALNELQIESDVNVSLITLEPDVDAPARLRAYGDLHAMVYDERFKLLNPDARTLDEMTKAVDLSVSRCCTTITNHEATLLLVDCQGKLASRHSVGNPHLRMRTVAKELWGFLLEDRRSADRRKHERR